MRFLGIISAWLLVTSIGVTPALATEILRGLIVGVSDGDTATLLVNGNHQVKIRLAQIDAPEKGQDYGQRSKQSLSDLIYGKAVTVEKITEDRYGRTVGTILVGDLDANREQIKRGMAWAYRKYLRDQSLLQLEEQARRERLGLWSIPNPIPPWEFRNGSEAREGSTPPTSTMTNKPRTDGLCGIKHTCKEMSSCSEARYYLKECRLTKLDRDGNGIPCESLCR